jgi:hypothetical protein
MSSHQAGAKSHSWQSPDPGGIMLGRLGLSACRVTEEDGCITAQVCDESVRLNLFLSSKLIFVAEPSNPAHQACNEQIAEPLDINNSPTPACHECDVTGPLKRHFAPFEV